VEVSPGVTLPIVGFAAEATVVRLSEVVQPGETVAIRVPIAVPAEVAEGRKVLRVRIGEAGPSGEMANLLDEEFFTGRLRVEVPRPPPVEEVPPVEMVPLPVEVPPVVSGRILRVETPQFGQELEGGRRITVRVIYENAGTTPHDFGVIAWAGRVVGPGQIEPDVQGSFFGFTVEPGQQSTVVVPLDLPQDPAGGFGSKDILVVLADLDPSGRIPIVTYDTSVLTRVFTLAAPPAPPEVVVPPRPLAFGDIRIDHVTASPTTAGPGELVTFTVPFANLGPVLAPLRIEAAIIDQTGNSVMDVAPATLDLPVDSREPGLDFGVSLPADIEPGSYGLGVDILDRTTNVLLAQQDFLALFHVPEEEVVVPPRALVLGDIRIDRVTASPAMAGPGDLVTFTVPLANLGLVEAPLRIEAAIIDQAGNSVLGIAPATVDLPVGRREPGLELGATLPADIQPDSYGLGVDILDRTTNVLLAQQDFLALFRVQEVAPAGLFPGDLIFLDPVATPELVNPGESVTIGIPLQSQATISPDVNMIVSVIGPAGNVVASFPTQTFRPTAGLTTVRQVPWAVPETATPQSYGVQVNLWDPNTFVPGDPSTFVVREQVFDVFTVEALPVEVVAPEVPVEEMPFVPAPPLEPQIPAFGDLGAPTITFPAQVPSGDVVRGQVSIPNLVDLEYPAEVDVVLNDSSGGFVQTLVRDMVITFNPLAPTTLGLEVNTEEFFVDSYGVRVTVRETITPQRRVLLNREIRGVLNVVLPVGLSGVNELDEPLVFYNDVLEPAEPIVKHVGDPTGGTFVFNHRGEGGSYRFGYGIAKAKLFGHNDPFTFFAVVERIPPHSVSTPVWVFIPSPGATPATWPTSAGDSGRYDAQKFITDLRTSRTIYEDWDDDVFEVAG
ncbi:hypothetical protein ACFLX9_02155, partial [Chloroflexota bacterium]